MLLDCPARAPSKGPRTLPSPVPCQWKSGRLDGWELGEITSAGNGSGRIVGAEIVRIGGRIGGALPGSRSDRPLIKRKIVVRKVR